MNDFQLLIDLHQRAERQGPGGEAETKQNHPEGHKKRIQPVEMSGFAFLLNTFGSIAECAAREEGYNMNFSFFGLEGAGI